MLIIPPMLPGGEDWVPLPTMNPLGARVSVPALSATLPQEMSSSPLPVTVTARVPKSSTQPFPIANFFVMLQGPVPVGHPESLALMLAAVHALMAACASRVGPVATRRAARTAG